MIKNDLFAPETLERGETSPLASRMSPRTLDEFTGQESILGPGKLLRRAIEADRLQSVILYGPPGTGKSALARIVAAKTRAHFEETNAVTVGTADIRAFIDQARSRMQHAAKKTILLLDEIHHFNKTQQDALLPSVEKGIITLIGITTENPFFYVNPALRSRSLLFEFHRLSEHSLALILRRALEDGERGLGSVRIELAPEAEQHLIRQADGDARRLLNALEIGALSTAPDDDGAVRFTLSVAEESLQKRTILYDKSGDEHYDHISAFIKSMRGSDPDAALYWMATMLAAGEDPRFIARRVIICASEDVGNADPHALMVAAAALEAVGFVGLPEGKIPLAQAVTYVASAPKSNAAYMALHRAEKEAAEGIRRAVPAHLKDSHGDSSARGHGKGYKYPHDHPGHHVEQEYWDDPVVLYEPSDQGYEVKIGERLLRWHGKKRNTPADARQKK